METNNSFYKYDQDSLFFSNISIVLKKEKMLLISLFIPTKKTT